MKVQNGEITVEVQCDAIDCKKMIRMDFFEYLIRCIVGLKYLKWNPRVLCDEHHEFFTSGTWNDNDPNTNPQFKSEQDEKKTVV